MIAAIFDILITASTKAFLGYSITTANIIVIVLAAFLFVFIGPAVYGVFFDEPLSWVEYYNNDNLFKAIITIGIFKLKR